MSSFAARGVSRISARAVLKVRPHTKSGGGGGGGGNSLQVRYEKWGCSPLTTGGGGGGGAVAYDEGGGGQSAYDEGGQSTFGTQKIRYR